MNVKNTLRILLSIIIGFFIGKNVFNFFTDNIILIRL